MSPRKAVEKELTREMILEAAHVMFIELGYQKVSMRQIAKELGYSHGSLYYHFKNKAELFSALVQEDFHKLNQLLFSVVQNEALSNEEKLEAIFTSYIEFGLTYPKQYELMFLFHDRDLSQCLEEAPYKSYHNFAVSVQSLIQNNLSIPLIWSTFLSLHGFVTHYLHSGQTYEDIRALAILHAKFLIKGLS